MRVKTHLLVLVLMAQLSFSALGLSGSGIEYSFNGSAISAVNPLCAMNTGNDTIRISVSSNDSCIRPLFTSGRNETELPPGAEDCIALAPECSIIPASVKLSAATLQGMIRTVVSRSARITAHIVPQAQGAANASLNATQNSGSGEMKNNGAYGIVLILVIVVVLVFAWCLLRYYHH